MSIPEQQDSYGSEMLLPQRQHLLASVLIPTFNEYTRLVDDPELGLAANLNAGHRALEKEFGTAYELVAVDDGSTDGTADYALENGASRVIRLPKDATRIGGRGDAIRTVLPELKGAVKGWVDADHSYAWSDVLRVIEPVAAGEADISAAVRNLSPSTIGELFRTRSHHATMARAFGHHFVYKVTEHIAKTGMPDTQGGLQWYTDEAARAIWPQTVSNQWGTSREAFVLANQLGFKVQPILASPRGVTGSRVNVVRDTINIIREAQQTRQLHL